MTLKDKIPEQFYALFRTKNRDYYMLFLVALYDENNDMYTSLGLTIEEAKQIVLEQMSHVQMEWQLEAIEHEQTQEDRQDASAEQESEGFAFTPAKIVNRLITWGWIKRDFDEKQNEYIISFPEYSQLYIELFKELNSDDSDRERESILAVYSALFTYQIDQEKNNDILRHALKTSKGLSQLLSNMQDGMRAYFDELSSRKDFLGIQEVLIQELNNSDSRRYAILTTTDSFYRYKEAVKELLAGILSDNDCKKADLSCKHAFLEKDTRQYYRSLRMMEYCDEAAELAYRIEREFTIIEQKYNKLIEQKTIFAKRALARIHYIMHEGGDSEDNTLRLIAMLDKSKKKEEILTHLSEKIILTTQFQNITEESLYRRKDRSKEEFEPVKLTSEESGDIADYVPKPLYTKHELDAFRIRNTKNGKFQADKEAIQSVEDLEKLMFIWNETCNDENEKKVTIEEEISNENGFTYTKLIIEE